jgi:hypothetical protein
MITKEIFTIWAGGLKMMPEKNIDVFKGWLKLNKDFHGVIYIDKQSTPKESLSAFEEMINADGSEIELRDITEAGVSDEYVRYEIDRMTPNYGKSSDLIRYNALYKFGGFYIDSDVQPGILPENLFDQDNPIFCVDDCAQGSDNVGNDAFLCSAKHPVMKRIMELAHSNYQGLHETWKDRYYNDFGPKPDPYILDFNSISMRGTHEEWVHRTIAMTGSGALHPALFEYDILQESGNIDAQYSLSKRGILKKIKGNDLGWTIPRMRNLTNSDKESMLEEAILYTLNSIKFEAKTMGLLRLDYHVHMIMCALGEQGFDVQYRQKGAPNANENKIAAILIERLEKSNDINYANINNLAWVSRHPSVRMFYQDNLESFFSAEWSDIHRHAATLKTLMDEIDEKTEKIELFNYYIEQIAKNEDNLNRDLKVRIDKAIDTINNTYKSLVQREQEGRPVPFFYKAYYNDGSRELIDQYHNLFSKAETLLDQKIILYSLLTSKGEQSIKDDILRLTEYPTIDLAIKSLQISLQREFSNVRSNEEFNDEVQTRIQQIGKRILLTETESESHFNSRHAFFTSAVQSDNINVDEAFENDDDIFKQEFSDDDVFENDDIAGNDDEAEKQPWTRKNPF